MCVVSVSHPECVDLRAGLEEVPDLVLVFKPSVSQFADFSQSVESVVGLDTHIKDMTTVTTRMITQSQNCLMYYSCKTFLSAFMMVNPC